VDTPQLEAFLNVVDIGSFTRAAARLGVAQPTITNRIKALERTLGVVLLERLPSGVRPSTAGTELLPYAREIVALSARARQALRNGGEPHGRVTVGSTECVTNHRLLPLLEYLFMRFPKVRVSMTSAPNGVAVSEVRDGRLDCAFFIDAARANSDVETRVLCPEPLVLVAGRDHPLTRAGEVTDDDLRGTTVVRSARCGDYHARFEESLGLTEESGQRRVFELDSVDAAKRTVANGMGVILLPVVAVAQELRDGELRRIDWALPFDTFTQVAWRRERAWNTALRALVRGAQRVVREQLADQVA
jgi:DNA-binding transcriptional LysR family regulator